MNAAEHIAWAKGRAMEYGERGDWSNAIASMISDLQKHPDTAKHANTFPLLGTTDHDARLWIEGFAGDLVEVLSEDP